MSVLVLRTPCPDCGVQGIYGGHVRNADNEDGFERCPGPGGSEVVLDPTTVLDIEDLTYQNRDEFGNLTGGFYYATVTVADVVQVLQGDS